VSDTKTIQRVENFKVLQRAFKLGLTSTNNQDSLKKISEFLEEKGFNRDEMLKLDDAQFVVAYEVLVK
jgi:hypothetical protein